MTSNRIIDLDKASTNSILSDLGLSEHSAGINWLGHKGKASVIDQLLLRGATLKELSEESGRTEKATQSHLYHLRKEHGLKVINSHGIHQLSTQDFPEGFGEEFSSVVAFLLAKQRAYLER